MTSPTYLLDANVLIALAYDGHDHKQRCDDWYATIQSCATCPSVEGSLVRYLIRIGHSFQTASGTLADLTADARHEFWPDSLSYGEVDLARVIGHRQVTDAYLVSLVRAHPGSKLATLDEGLALMYPDVVELIPELPVSPEDTEGEDR
ncbi:MAG: PIN domain-containing protein [Propionibacteriaceae bacterium]|jgi:predicted nucleic acid-binding protein|nr:PIN domain-containing protein [Propionibacteriaceae bacterium]